MSGVILKFGMSIFDEVFGKYSDDLKDMAFNFITDKIESALVGKRTLDEWAEIVVEVIDNIKDSTVRENNYKFIGGKLIFGVRPKIKSKVIISYELYFIDSDGNFFKNSASSDVNQDIFVEDDISALKKAGEIIYEVEDDSN